MRSAFVIAALALAACDPAAVTASDSPSNALGALAPSDLPAFFDCLRENGQTIVAAHRGGPEPGYAENAIPTFAHTLARGPAFLEVDVARTRDGALVLMHDDGVARTTNGEGDVAALTFAQFQALQMQDEDGATLDAHPPSLREALDWAVGKTVLELDVKRGVSYEDVAREVRDADAMGRVVFITYSVNGAVRLHSVAPEAMIYVTIESANDLAELERRGVDLSHIVAWTGTDEPNSALNVALAQREVEVSFGTLGHWDRSFTRGGDYAAFAETGLQVISTDRAGDALRDLDANDGVEGYGAMQCVSAQ